MEPTMGSLKVTSSGPFPLLLSGQWIGTFGANPSFYCIMSIDRDRPIQTIRPGLHPSRATIAVATKTRYAERRLGNAWNHRDAADRGWVFICELWLLPNTGFRIANVQRLLDFGPEFYPTNVFDPEPRLPGHCLSRIAFQIQPHFGCRYLSRLLRVNRLMQTSISVQNAQAQSQSQKVGTNLRNGLFIGRENTAMSSAG
jgi:hypothetical protein